MRKRKIDDLCITCREDLDYDYNKLKNRIKKLRKK